ncbi:transcriptional regulator [Lachnospiraceae bacterium JC7]|nr:transcriptional regulator [Lachnospiraceae bacterium JC7]
MNIIETLDHFKNSYTSNERKLYNLISKDPDLIHNYTITQIASLAGVSTSAMLRFCKRLGFNGYKEFKFEVESWLRLKDKNSVSDDPVTKIANAFSEAILSIPGSCDASLKKLAEDITGSDKVVALGRYRNKVVCDKLAMNMTNLGITCMTASDLLTYEHYEKIIDQNSTVIVFSVLHDMRSYQTIINDIAQLTDKFWLITTTGKKTKKLNFTNIISLPSTHSGILTLDQQAIMIILVEILTYILRQD